MIFYQGKDATKLYRKTLRWSLSISMCMQNFIAIWQKIQNLDLGKASIDDK